MVESVIKPEQYKLVIDPKSGNKWIKERNKPGTDDKSCTRHHIQIGPKGGEYFVNNAGKSVYLATIHNITTVYEADSQSNVPDERDDVHYGNTGQDRRR